LPAPLRDLIRGTWSALRAKGTGVSPRLAVVEDEESVREFIGDALADNGYEVDLAADGAEALRLCEKARYDLILSDLRMPRMDGAALYQELRLRYGSSMPPMIFVTARPHSLDYARFLRATSVPVLAKPFTVHRLREAVRQALGEGT
jgi:CheY-like chemotaxis protein